MNGERPNLISGVQYLCEVFVRHRSQVSTALIKGHKDLTGEKMCRRNIFCMDICCSTDPHLFPHTLFCMMEQRKSAYDSCCLLSFYCDKKKQHMISGV